MRAGDFEIKRTGKGIAEVSKYTGSDTAVTVPEEIDGYRIVQIGSQFLRKSNKVEKLVLPPSVEAINPQAFSTWRNMVAVEVSGKRLSSVDGVLYDGGKKTLLFYPPKHQGDEFVLPSSVSSVEETAFQSAVSLNRIYVSGQLSSFSVNPASLPALEEIVQEGDMKSMKVSEGVLFKGKKLVFYPAAKHSVSYSIPDGVEEICSGFSSNLRMLSVPGSVRKGLEDNAKGLESINVDRSNTHYRSVDGVLFSSSGTLLAYPSARKAIMYTVPQGTSSIADEAFRDASIMCVQLPSGITSIGREVFAGSSIGAISLPLSLVNIDMMAFDGADSIREMHVDRGSAADVFLQARYMKNRIVYNGYF